MNTDALVLIGKDCAVSIEYTLKNSAGETLDTSVGGEPLTYLHGRGNIVPGLERELTGLSVARSVTVVVKPEDGYGVRDDRKQMQVKRSELPQDMEPEVGMQIGAHDQKGQLIPLWITVVGKDAITLDGNHPLAGETLHFDVTIKHVRPATAQELEHGHVHGHDGHAAH